MEKRPPIVLLLLFLEEFFVWEPGRLGTLAERLLLLAFKSTSGFDQEWLTWLNPGLAIVLFLIVVGSTVTYLRSLLSSATSTDLILFVNRYSIIRIILAAAVALWVLRQLMATLSGDLGSLVELYRDKSFWTMLFVGMAAYKFVSP